MTMKEDNKDNPQECKKVPLWCSSRLGLSVVGFFGCISLYLMRINMGVAVVCMTRDPSENRTHGPNASAQGHWRRFRWVEAYSEQDWECNEVLEDDGSARGEFEWNRELRGWVNSSFFIGYLLTQVAGGWLAARYSAKWTLAAGMALTIAASLLSPVAARGSVYLLMLMRVIKGLGSAVYFPCTNQMWGSWAPPNERSFLMSFMSSGNSIGSIFSFFVSGILCDTIGWQWIFYIYGLVALVWLVFWVLLVFDSPDSHPRTSAQERAYLEWVIDARPKDKEKVETPWRAIMTSRALWAILIADFCHAWGGYTALTSMTQYTKDILEFDIKQSGLYNSLPYVCQWAGTIVYSIIVDAILTKGLMRRVVVRKLFGAIAMVPAAILLVVVSFLDCYDAMGAVAILCLVQCFVCANRVSMLPNKVDIAPRYTGVIMGITNTASTIPGIISPIITGYLTPNGSQEEWQRVFIISAAVYALGALVYLLMASVEVQPWGRLPQDDLTTCVVDTKKTGGRDNQGFESEGEKLAYSDTTPAVGTVLQEGYVYVEKF